MPLLALAALAAFRAPQGPEAPSLSPLVGTWNYPQELTSVWALRVARRPDAGRIDLAPMARRVLLRHKVRVLTDAEAGSTIVKGGKVVFDGGRADTLDLTMRPVRESKEGLTLCSVAVYRTVVRRGPRVYREVPLLLYQTIGYARGPKAAVAEIERQLNELGKGFEVGREWDARDAKLPPPKPIRFGRPTTFPPAKPGP